MFKGYKKVENIVFPGLAGAAVLVGVSLAIAQVKGLIAAAPPAKKGDKKKK